MKGIVTDESLTDLGISAYRGANRIKGALGGFLKLVEAGKVAPGSYLIVESLDRISRQEVMDVLPSFTALLQAGIVIVNRAVVGEYQSYTRDEDGKRIPAGEPKVGYFPAIVDEATFLRANAAKEGRATAPGIARTRR